MYECPICNETGFFRCPECFGPETFQVDQLNESVEICETSERATIEMRTYGKSVEKLPEPKPHTVGALLISLHDLREEHPMPRLSDEVLPRDDTFFLVIWCANLLCLAAYFFFV